jgi:putative Holliday junction resolvase
LSRILAVDWGERRIGLAVSDPTGLIARALPTLLVRSPEQAALEVLETCRTEEVERIVVGLPLRLDGTRGDAAEAAERFARRLESGGFPVEMWDERLTSVEAERQMRELGQKVRGRKEKIDARAAAVLLQSYLDERGPRTRGWTP